MTSMQLSDGPVTQDAGVDQRRPGRNGLVLATPGTSGLEAPPPHE